MLPFDTAPTYISTARVLLTHKVTTYIGHAAMDYDPIGGCGRRVHAAFVPAQLDPPKPKRSILVSSYPLCLYLSRIALHPPGPPRRFLASLLPQHLPRLGCATQYLVPFLHPRPLSSKSLCCLFLFHGERRCLACTVGPAILRPDVSSNVRWSLPVSDATTDVVAVVWSSHGNGTAPICKDRFFPVAPFLAPQLPTP